jgi:hypothetical protein
MSTRTCPVRPSAVRFASAAAVVALAACTSSEPRTAPSPAPEPAPAAVSESKGGSPTFLPSDTPGVWNPVRPGVAVAFGSDRDPDVMGVTYRRDAGKPAGLALMLAPGACTAIDGFSIRAAATPSQRCTVCLTDRNGVVWTFPTVKLGAAPETHLVRLADLRPDPFQNTGKTVPQQPDLGSMTMLTILDISGFMGAPVEDCSWSVEFVRGEEVTR